jgi:hypothetical protein
VEKLTVNGGTMKTFSLSQGSLTVMLAFLLGAAPASANHLPKPNKELGTSIRVYLAAQNAGDFRKLADNIDLQTDAPKQMPRRVLDSNRCDTGKQDAVITIWATKDSHTLAHKGTFRSKQASHTWIVGRMEVTGCDFVELGLSRGHRAYWVVEPDDDDLTLRSHFIDVGGIGGSATQEKDLTADIRWTFAGCPQEHASINTDQAAVQPRSAVCTIHDGASIVAASRNPQADMAKMTKAALADRVDPPSDPFIWIVCADECCYASQELISR